MFPRALPQDDHLFVALRAARWHAQTQRANRMAGDLGEESKGGYE